MERLDLAVIESRWWEGSNDSVRGLFDMLAGLHCDNPFAYHYEMFNNKESLQEIIPRVAARNDIHNIYVGSHGDAESIHGAGNNRISRASLWHILGKVGSRRLYGAFFGCCSFGDNIVDILEKSNLSWLAGYTEKIDWLHSSAMDLFFWNAYFQSSVPGETKRDERSAAMVRLLSVLHRRVPYMFDELGFQVAVSFEGEALLFPSGQDEPYEGILERAQSFINEHPGDWP